MPDTLAKAQARTVGETLGYVDFEERVYTLVHTIGEVDAESL